jgi:hypothetical protein
MKKIIILSVLVLAINLLSAQNVGIGTTAPQAMLHVADSAVLFTGPVILPATTVYNPPASGPGSRMMWYPQKAAFRVGNVSADNWNKDSIGTYSFSSGLDTKAEGSFSASFGFRTSARENGSFSTGVLSNANGFVSTSLGYSNLASGVYSTSVGSYNTSSGNSAFTSGQQNVASGDWSSSMGLFNLSSGMHSFSIGVNSVASGRTSTSTGANTNAIGDYSFSMGNTTYAYGAQSTSMGLYTKALSINSLVIGRYNDTSNTNRLFEIGNGIASNIRSNALTVLTNGNVGIGNSNPSQPLSFSSSIGKKISFYQGGTGEYGMGVWSGELRLYTDLATGKVSFGVDNYSSGYTELGFFQRNGAYAMSVLGSIWANGVTYASDERFKQNITPITSPLQKLLQLNGVEYDMKKDAFQKNNFAHGRQIGLLAQNVEKLVPEAVSENADGYKGVDYAKLVPLLVEAMKELSKQNKALQTRIDKLEQQQ